MPVTYSSPGWRKTVESVKTPGYHRLRRQGSDLPLNPYSRQEWRWKSSHGYDGVRKGDDFVHNGTVYLSQDMSVQEKIPTVHEMAQRVNNRLDSRIRDTDVDLAVMLGEYKESAGMVVSAANAVVNAVKLAKKRRYDEALLELVGQRRRSLLRNSDDNLKGKPYDIPKAMSDTWLGLQYGIIPLLRDVHAVVEKLSSTYNGFPKPLQVRTRLSEPIKTHLSRISVDPNWGDTITSTLLFTGFVEGSGGVTYWVDNPLMRTLDQVGVLNPMSVAWELTRLSFVVDWFIPIGDYLQSFVPPQGVKFSSGWVATKASTTLEETHDDTGNLWRSASSSNSTATYAWKSRGPLSGLPQARLLIPDVSLTKSQITSGLALLTQEILRKDLFR